MNIKTIPEGIILPPKHLPGCFSAYLKFHFLFTILFAPSLLFSGSGIRASNDNYPAGARAAALSNVAVMYPDFWSVWHNQAGLGYYTHFSAGIHHENRFMVPELALNCIGVTIPTSTGTFGISCTHFGYPNYNENKIGLALGKAFHERFAVGLQINYLDVFINDDFGRSGTVAIEAGIIAEPIDNLMIGFHVFNPTASSFPKMEGERIPVILRMGMGYQFSDRLFLGAETEKDLELGKAFAKMGMEYRLIEYIYIRTGLSVHEYVQHSFGLGFSKYNFQADIAFSFQPVLGYTPFFSLLYVFQQNKRNR